MSQENRTSMYNYRGGRSWRQWAQFNCFWIHVRKMSCQELLCLHILVFSLRCITTEWFSPSVFIIFAYISRDFFLNNQPDALIIQIYSVIKLYMFRSSSLPNIMSSLLYIRHVRMELQFRPDSGWKRSSKTCLKFTSAEFTVQNSWWWAEKMSETCRILWQNTFW